MTTKLSPQKYFWILIILLLTARGAETSLVAKTPTIIPPSVVIAPTLTNPPPTITMTVIPPSILLPSPGTPYDPTPWPTWTPFPNPFPKFSWDGYVLTFIKGGDLYFQDGNNQPVKLTHVGEKSYPRISDDNRKIFFYRNDWDVYSINTDGTQEKF